MIEWIIQMLNPKAVSAPSFQVIVQGAEKDVKIMSVDEYLPSSDENEDVKYKTDSNDDYAVSF